VNRLREGAPEDAAALGAQLLLQPVHLLVDHEGRHPVHVVKQRRHSVLLVGVLLAHIHQRALEEGETAIIESGAQLHERLALEVLGAARLRVLARNVTVVEIVVKHHVGCEDALENSLEVVKTVESELQLARWHTCHHSPSKVGNYFVNDPAEDSQTTFVAQALVLELLVAALLHKCAADEAQTQR